MPHRSIISREGWPYIGLFVMLTIILSVSSYRYYLLLPLVMAIFTTYFFRNPERKIPTGEGLILAPADGKVMAVNEIWENDYLQANCIRVSIFLSLFNVHVNRIPLGGKVEWLSRSGRTYLPAYRNDAADTNVSNTVGILSGYGKIMVVQITGMIARRIVCWLQPGDMVETGERFGLIKFGSCTELYLPADAIILVKPGDKVKGGETILGRFSN